MSAKVYKPSSAVQIAAFRFPELGESIAPHAPELSGLSESFLGETVDFEPFIEVERKSPATVDEILQDAQEQAAQIIAQAEKDKEMIEQAAREKAEQEARAVIEAEVEERIREIRENLAQSMREVSALRDEISARVEKDVVELALEIAKKIVGREVMFDREIALTLVKVSLKKINSRTPLAQIHLHPEDYRYIEARREQIDFRGSLELIEDRSISPGGCLIHTETGEIDARIESQFEEIAYGLLGS